MNSPSIVSVLLLRRRNLFRLGDEDRVFEWLEKAYEKRARTLVRLKVEPELDHLRSDARFENLLQRMNFPPLIFSHSNHPAPPQK
jgi:hypothetical protein